MIKKYTLLLACLIVVQSLIGQQFSNEDYEKEEVYITMRDGVRLFTAIYRPRKAAEDLPVIIKRTPYSVGPYGDEKMKQVSHNPHLVESGYIFVFQDMRGRFMSEGDFENTKPPYSFWDASKTDEVTDSWDTYQWLVDSLEGFNGCIGQYGNSYLGFTSLLASTTGHPALKAVMPMAPVTDFYFEDFSRYGLFAINYIPVIDMFGHPRTGPFKEWSDISYRTPYIINQEKRLYDDYYDFFLKRKNIKSMEDILHPENYFWKELKEHPNYDEFRQQRGWIQYLDSAKCKVMVVGGWNDEQNLYGILNAYRELETKKPALAPQLVIGPWSHGHNKRRDGQYRLGNIYYGDSISEDFQRDIEFPYFEKYLKNIGEAPDFSAKVFNMGTHEWETYANNPFTKMKDSITLYLADDASLSATSTKGFRSFTSDPDFPVPFIQEDDFYRMAPKHYMNDDQRFVTKRPDVLSFVSPVLTDTIDVNGIIKALIDFSTDHGDADIYVKIIDILPMDLEPLETDAPGLKMNGYQKLVRLGYIRGRFRDSFDTPKPFKKNKKTTVDVPLLEVRHTFLPGHRIMIQIQSSMFPLFDINPQNYVENIFEAELEDFEPALHKVFGTSRLVLPVMK